MRTLYRLLLALFLPRTLRKAHGRDMQALFSETITEARVRGRAAELKAALAGMLDIASRAPREHWLRSGPAHTQHQEHPVQSFLIDVRHAFRSFTRHPGATALVLSTLTLAVGANIAVFTLLDGVFRRPFPFPASDRLVYLNERAPKWNLDYTNINFADFVAWRERANAFEGMALFQSASRNIGNGDRAERVLGLRVTHDFASVLRVPLVLGRMFSAAEDLPNGPPVVVISVSTWKNQFGGTNDVLGKTLRINSVPHTIVGILPAEAGFPIQCAFWLPIGGDPADQHQSYSFDGIGRLKPKITLAQATQSLFDAQANIWAVRDTARVVSPLVLSLRERLVGNYRATGTTLALAAALVFCIACANVAGTMLARSIARQSEVGIRVALGASSRRIVSQLLTESFVLSAAAGLLGAILAKTGIALLVRNADELLPPWALPEIDATSVLFSAAIVAVAALLFGLAPALQLRKHVAKASSVGGTRSTSALPERRLLNALVVSEVALATCLLITGGLLFKSYDAVRNIQPGFQSDGVATFQLSLPHSVYPNATQQVAVFHRVQERLSALPGVDHVGLVNCLPLSCRNGNFYRAEGEAPRSSGDIDPVVNTRYATSDYFAAMGIQLKSGRFFRDGEGSSKLRKRVAVINEQFAEHLWPGALAEGKRFTSRDNTADNWITVVGVVRDVRHGGLLEPIIPDFYMSTTALDSTDEFSSVGVAVHTRASADELLPVLRRVAREIIPDIPLFEVRTMRDVLDRSMTQQRLVAFSLAALAAIAMCLSMGGIYAVLSYVVGRRRREIAIRMAVGAQRGQVVRMVLRQGAAITAAGLLIGVPLAAAGARALSATLVGVSPSDPAVYAFAVVLLAVVATVAAVIPALRAARFEPKSVLSASV
ncbi:MAG: ABC transporter permease [Gemmatimonas sp.]